MTALKRDTKYKGKNGHTYEVMNQYAAEQRGLVRVLDGTRAAKRDTYIVFSHTTRIDVYFGNKDGAMRTLKTLCA